MHSTEIQSLAANYNNYTSNTDSKNLTLKPICAQNLRSKLTNEQMAMFPERSLLGFQFC